MIENPIFRPWNNSKGASKQLLNFERTDTFIPDIERTEFTKLTTNLVEECNKKLSPTIGPVKLPTDADRLKRMLSNEKRPNELKKTDKKFPIIKKVAENSSSKTDQQLINKSNQQPQSQPNITNSPASSSASTRLMNSRIAAFSHLLNIESYSRLTAPINNTVAGVSQMPLNFILPNSLPPNNLSVPNSTLPNNSLLFNNPTNLPPIPEISNLPHSNLNPLPNQILSPVHPLPVLPNSLPTTLPLNNPLLPTQLINNPPLPITAPLPNQIPPPAIIYNSVSHQPQPVGNQQLNYQPPSVIENSQFPTPADVLMASFKKSHTIQLPKKNRPKKFCCNHCPANFANNGQLKGHIRTHTGERPFACDFENCYKRFTRNEELTRHKKIHSGEKPFPCDICSKRFGRKDHLKKHIRTHERAAAPQHFAIPYLTPYYYFKV